MVAEQRLANQKRRQEKRTVSIDRSKTSLEFRARKFPFKIPLEYNTQPRRAKRLPFKIPQPRQSPCRPCSANNSKRRALPSFNRSKNWDIYSWFPSGGPQNLATVDSAEEITKYLQFHGLPNQLVDHRKIHLPFEFHDLHRISCEHEFPYGKHVCAALHVAQKYRGLSLSISSSSDDDDSDTTIDFCFGGSTLNMLANPSQIKDPYFAIKAPGTKIILIIKCKKYITNLSEPGFQFERLMTGQRTNDEHASFATTEHLHTMKIGNYGVLFQAEIDAEHQGAPVEITASNSRYWSNKKVFQMISNGSPHLCHGIKSREAVVDISLRTLSDCAEEANISYDRVERKILEGMKDIKSQMKSAKTGQPYRVAFQEGALKLTLAVEATSSSSTRHVVLLPPEHVMHELLD